MQRYSALEVFSNALFGIRKNRSDKFFALKDISFTIHQGETVGVVGLNGSGKSTLLQIIAGTTKASSGKFSVCGKLAAILELGSGFNPNFTGIENIFLNSSLHGFSKYETEKILDDIIDFAGIGVHANLPVSTYSNGMVVRLAYAIVANIKPDILLVDEALAVGDFLFQQKCIDSMSKLRSNGTSILFVSHSVELIAEFCSKVLVLNKGKQIFFGQTKDGIHKYQELMLEQKEKETYSQLCPKDKVFKINSLVSLQNCTILQKGVELSIIDNSSGKVQLVITLVSKADFEDLHCGFNILDSYGRVIFGTTTFALKHYCGMVTAGQSIVFSFTLNQKLRGGKYSITVGVADKGYGFPDSLFRNAVAFFENAFLFEVLHDSMLGKWSGYSCINTTVNSSKKFL